MNRLRLIIVAGCVMIAGGQQAQAVDSLGSIAASLTLTNGCLINGSPSQSGINFGTLNFGSQPATFSTLSTQLTGAASGNTFAIQCTTTSYTVQVTSNTNVTTPGTTIGTPGTPARYLMNAANTTGVAYSLYTDATYNTVVANNAPLPVASTTGGTNNYTLYGRIQGGGNSVTVAPGVYTDVINVSVTY
ncbi:spore coat protein U-like protein [Enterobacter sp. BIGb0383]|uniref:spore coat protein U domain-containing protein n=1 Tax=unclassified Enterobacter TaxID=2608935 RepID=UPI000F46C5FF|nr:MULTISPECIES: spore coat protein U domain-containing protein [unclassified Enterobacter]ROP62504.1 spore coat protein U-like protein [Enterobacter sp. BIGb0383]ROS12664.1 spore coat protein U-like protein [Enterobacter sp. BIGb0359]